ncbi:MAG: segregation and condensation protein A [Sphingomonadaceae bacterium]
MLVPVAVAQQPSETSSRPSIELELATPAFSGPLALLLELIEKRRLPITEISLAEVADQYLERMRTMVGLDPDLLSDFLVIAARLLVIKSRELLPSPPPVANDEEDVAEQLRQRLLEYRIFRDAAEQLKQLEETGRRSYQRQPSGSAGPRPEPPLAPIEPEALRDAMVRMAKALQPESRRLELAPRVSVQERMAHLIACLTSSGSAVFSEVGGTTVEEIVATFLALLELLRQHIIEAVQETAFGEIRLSLAASEAT